MDFDYILVIVGCFFTGTLFLFIERIFHDKKRIKEAHQKEEERKIKEKRDQEIENANKALSRKRLLERKRDEVFSLSRNVQNVIVTRRPELMRVFQKYSELIGVDCQIISAGLSGMDFVLSAHLIPLSFLDQLDSYPKETHFYFGTRFGPDSKYTGFDLIQLVKERYPESKNYIISMIKRNSEYETMMLSGVLDNYFNVDDVERHLWNEIGVEMYFQKRLAALKGKREIPVSSL